MRLFEESRRATKALVKVGGVVAPDLRCESSAVACVLKGPVPETKVFEPYLGTQLAKQLVLQYGSCEVTAIESCVVRAKLLL